ncbi:GNAT family N-acetyltransferase [Anaerocolumna sp. AGMB13020]|uniref:GNAT family N-acetyltransferase n=1 Tax=Anaerocolumna sp. AGMB13020 TaxID=3081750 RepID=UPI00295451EC|nr:GNAT family N-acetyltransferase [Anaerocolumna sp. AGMB13020]WOO35485.1 GNAT family N-acetyltransferase [Anaerocolumna sp. AGMB13020]
MKIEKAVLGDLDNIITVLDEVTLRLLEKEIPQWSYPWYREEIEKDLPSQYVVREEGSVIAVFSLKPLDSCFDNKAQSKEDYYLHRIAVLPEYQGKGIGEKILRFVQKFSIKQERNIYLDCYQGNKKLRQFYEKAGFYYQGDYPEENYLVSVFRFLWQKDSPAKNRFRNACKRRQKELRVAKWSLLSVLLLMLIFGGFWMWDNVFHQKIPLNPAIVVGNTVYWQEEGSLLTELPYGATEAGKIEDVLKDDIWPSKEMQAVGISGKLKGETVYLDSNHDKVYIKDESKNYLIFSQEFTVANNNYSNGFYEMLLKACGEKDTIPLMEIPADYTVEQAIEDKIPYYKEINNGVTFDGVAYSGITSEGVEYMEAFMQKAKDKKNTFIRIGYFDKNNTSMERFIDLFYYKGGYYIFSGINPDIVNARFSYLISGKYYYDNVSNVFLLTREKEDTSILDGEIGMSSISIPIFIEYQQ